MGLRVSMPALSKREVIDAARCDPETHADHVGRHRHLRAPDLMLERQREGIARAAAEGKYKGRAPTARSKAAGVLRMAKAGQTRDTIAADLGIGVASVYRILAEARATGAIAA